MNFERAKTRERTVIAGIDEGSVVLKIYIYI